MDRGAFAKQAHWYPAVLWPRIRKVGSLLVIDHIYVFSFYSFLPRVTQLTEPMPCSTCSEDWLDA